MNSDAIVIGAGAAGLAAALSLAERSFRVTVLEARDRPGGRVRWERMGTVDEPAELGAEFIHGDAPETAAYMAAAGLQRVATGESSWTCGTDGRLEPDDDEFASDDLFARAHDLGADESVETFLRRFEGDPLLRERSRAARAFVEGFEAADPALASVRAIAAEIGSGVDSTSARPVGGYAPLFDDLALRCARAGVDLRYETVVERIAWRAGSVSVDVRSAGEAATRHARCAIVTVPIGVLQQGAGAVPLAFAPPLPPATRAAIDGLAMGQVVRVTLAFRAPFWQRIAGGRYRDAAFFRCDAGSFNAFWTQAPLPGRTIVAWAGGRRAIAMHGLTEAQRIERAADAFGSLFGARDAARELLEGGITHDWATDPLACGAYSYVLAGAGTARAALATPIDGTLFFAGEATATDGQGGTVSGAFATGMRAANEVVDARDR